MIVRESCSLFFVPGTLYFFTLMRPEVRTHLEEWVWTDSGKLKYKDQRTKYQVQSACFRITVQQQKAAILQIYPPACECPSQQIEFRIRQPDPSQYSTPTLLRLQRDLLFEGRFELQRL